MPMLNLTAYAETHGVKKQSASEWKRNGLLVMDGNMIDVEASDARMKAHGMGRFRVPGHGGPRQASPKPSKPRGLSARRGNTPPPTAAPALTDGREPYQRYEEPDSLAGQLRAAWDAGEDADFAEHIDTIASNCHSEDCRIVQWSRWPDAVAKPLASALGIDDASRVAAALAPLIAAQLAAGYGVGADDITAIERDLIAAGTAPGSLSPHL